MYTFYIFRVQQVFTMVCNSLVNIVECLGGQLFWTEDLHFKLRLSYYTINTIFSINSKIQYSYPHIEALLLPIICV